jgi:ornithine carbamoyltransferase
VEDAGQVMSRMCDIIMVRTFGQDIIERFAANSRVPVINGLTNEHHPCQVLADIFTYYEHRGSITGKTVAWVGDANNMLYSWLQAAEVFGFHLNVSTPKGYDIDRRWSTDRYTFFDNPSDACAGAHLVNTDVWTSMGYEKENAERLKAFDGFIVDAPRWRAPRRTRCSCTACPPIAARKSRPKSSTARSRWSGTKRRTACTCRRP